LKLEFSRQIVEKYSNITFMKIPPVGAEIFLRDRRTDRHNEASCHFSEFFESVYILEIKKYKIIIIIIINLKLIVAIFLRRYQ